MKTETTTFLNPCRINPKQPIKKDGGNNYSMTKYFII